MILTYLLFIVGLVCIIKGGDYFVDSATWIARRTGLSEVLIGATIVSLATTSPEATVSIISSVQGHSSIALGNAIGSIICNTGLILGLYNIIKPSRIQSHLFKTKGLMMLGYIGILWWLASNGTIGRMDSIILLVLLVIYIIYNISAVRSTRNKPNSEDPPHPISKKEVWVNGAKFVFGIGLILIGSKLLVDHGIMIAQWWGVPEAVISLTMIALGTSLPELITCMSALAKGYVGLSIGNILGANILNVAMVIGLSAGVHPLEISQQAIYLHIPVALGITSLLVIPTLLFKKISRIQAILLLGVYLIYIGALFFII